MPLFKTNSLPDIVIHAAALKHVPYLEADWGEGIKTNIFGSVDRHRGGHCRQAPASS